MTGKKKMMSEPDMAVKNGLRAGDGRGTWMRQEGEAVC